MRGFQVITANIRVHTGAGGEGKGENFGGKRQRMMRE
jgi:hypothetical protein